MPQAQITVNGVAGSNDDLPINTIVLLNNNGIGGETTYNWTILDQPAGTADVLSNAAIQNPSFTPKKEGTYLLLLVVNQGTGTEVRNQVIVGIRQVKNRERIPAAGETTEDSAPEGWHIALSKQLQRVDALGADLMGTTVGVAAVGGLQVGDVLHVVGTTTIKTGLPGQETVPTFNKAPANVADNVNAALFILVGGVDGSPTPGNGAVIRVRAFGMVYGLVGSPAGIGSLIFASDAARPTVTSGTNTRRIGSVAAIDVGGGTFDFYFSGLTIP